MTTKRLACWWTGVAGIAAMLTGVALATPGAGVVGTVMARAGFAPSVDLMFTLKDDGDHGTDIIHVRDAQDSVVQQITFSPGGHTGWHSHPGPTLVLVTQGELTLYSADDPTCTGRTYSAGQAFIDRGQGHIHTARASQTENTVLWAVYFDVPPGGAFRIDEADPGTCAF